MSAGMVGGKRVGGDDPERGQEAVEAVELWREARRRRWTERWVRRLMSVPGDDNDKPKQKEASDGQ